MKDQPDELSDKLTKNQVYQVVQISSYFEMLLPNRFRTLEGQFQQEREARNDP